MHQGTLQITRVIIFKGKEITLIAKEIHHYKCKQYPNTNLGKGFAPKDYSLMTKKENIYKLHVSGLFQQIAINT